MRTAIVLFTRDLRIHDNPVLHAAAASAERVLPLHVQDEELAQAEIGRAPGRRAFLAEALVDLDAGLRRLGAGLHVRRGDVVAETVEVARGIRADAVFCAADVTPYAARRERRLSAALDLRAVDAHFVVPPGAVAPSGGDHYLVFSPYHRAWEHVPVGQPLPPPGQLRLPDGTSVTPPPAVEIGSSTPPGGEAPGRAAMARWLEQGVDGYEDHRDDPGVEGTSRLSPYLHFGCVSARELAVRARRAGAASFVRQLAWRDFYAQLMAARPRTVRADLRSRGDRWLDDAEALSVWKEGATGYPLVDAGMRQLRAEGWMHNRARLVTASFLTKHLGIDWREGASHFFDLLVDGDVAQNVGNWQWVAGVGADTRPNRVFNPTAQARRLDPRGDYIRRWLPELADVPAPLVFEPGMLVPAYPTPIVDHAEAVAAFRRRRGRVGE